MLSQLTSTPLVLFANSPGSSQAPPLAVLTGYPGAQEVCVSVPAAVEILLVELFLQLHGEYSVLALLLDPTHVVLVKRLLADGAAPLQVRVPVWVQVFGLLLPLLAPP